MLAGMLMALVLGSLHAFSIFLEPLEARFDAPRQTISLTYSLALACLTAGVLFGQFVYLWLRPAALAATICLLAGAGALLAAFAGSLPVTWIGYSLVFGGANGLGYGFALQISAQANPDRKGLAMGLVTAAYALGAVIAPLPFELLIRAGGFTAAMLGLTLILALVAPLTAVLLVKAQAELKVARRVEKLTATPQRSIAYRLWLGYGTASAAGLMAIGHATGIARAGGLSDWFVTSAPIVIAFCNMIGSLLGGRLADRIGINRMLMAFPMLSSAALFLLVIFPSGVFVFPGLAATGFAYGAVITIYPAAVSAIYGTGAAVRVYGFVFTAWGLAGLLAPWLAGLLYEASGDYRTALALAACVGLVSLLVAGSLRTRASLDQD